MNTQTEDLLHTVRNVIASHRPRLSLIYFSGKLPTWMKTFSEELSELGIDTFVMLRELVVPISGDDTTVCVQCICNESLLPRRPLVGTILSEFSPSLHHFGGGSSW